MGPIFISYSSKDRDRIVELANALGGHGFDVWWDTYLPPGGDWDERIQHALEAAQVILVVWSEASMQSREVRAEATYGLQEGKLLPIRIEDVRLWARYSIVQYRDIFSRPPETDPNWSVIVEHLRIYAGTPEADGAPEQATPVSRAPMTQPVSRPVRGGAVLPSGMILPSAFTGAGGLAFLVWLASSAGDSPGSDLQLYSAIGLLAIGLVSSAMSLFRSPGAA